MFRLLSISMITTAVAVSIVFAQKSPSPQNLFVTVESTKTDFVSGLKAEHFRVFENNVEQKITSVLPGGGPVSIGILFDVSDSMTWATYTKDIEDAAAGIYEAVGAQSQRNEYFLMGFNKRAVLMTDWTANPEDISRGLRGLPAIQTTGQGRTTVVYDTCFEALEKLTARKAEKKVLIAFTDGLDGSSKHRRDEVIEFARDNNIQVYSLSINEPLTTGDTRNNARISELTRSLPRITPFLDDITRSTGGAAYSVVSRAPGNLDRDYKEDGRSPFRRKIDLVFAALSSQYTLLYSPAAARAGSQTKVEVKLILNAGEKKGKGVISLRFREKFRPRAK